MNKIVVFGRLGKEPVVKDTYASFSLASDEGKSSSGEKLTEWFNIKVFGKTIQTVEKYCRKGLRVIVSGRLQTNEYQGKKNYDIICDSLNIIDFPEESKQASEPHDYNNVPRQLFDDDDVPF